MKLETFLFVAGLFGVLALCAAGILTWELSDNDEKTEDSSL
jgi:hypothetical protein